jgi:hypothetical protein
VAKASKIARKSTRLAMTCDTCTTTLRKLPCSSVIVPAVLARPRGCSNKDQEVTSTPTSAAPKTDDSVKVQLRMPGMSSNGISPRTPRPGPERLLGRRTRPANPFEREGRDQAEQRGAFGGWRQLEKLQATVKCDALTGAQNTQCMTDAAATYRA